MIDHDKFDNISRRMMELEKVEHGIDLGSMSLVELVALRDDINSVLPDTTKMDLHQELSTQYMIVKDYQSTVVNSDSIPVNQVAQVMNSTVAALGQLIKMQESLERVETFKKMERCLIEAVTLLPEAAREKFFSEYEALALDKGLLAA